MLVTFSGCTIMEEKKEIIEDNYSNNKGINNDIKESGIDNETFIDYEDDVEIGELI